MKTKYPTEKEWNYTYEEWCESKKEKEEEKYCPKCDSKLEVEKEKEIDYPYVCKSCDENFYEFETKTK
tara:strand:- start:2 stop:205 length:204 start_codon:yes stop_codon:yes gene_type:complete